MSRAKDFLQSIPKVKGPQWAVIGSFNSVGSLAIRRLTHHQYNDIYFHKVDADNLRSYRRKNILGWFATKLDAEQAIEKGVEVWNSHNASVAAARAMLRKAEAARRDAQKATLREESKRETR